VILSLSSSRILALEAFSHIPGKRNYFSTISLSRYTYTLNLRSRAYPPKRYIICVAQTVPLVLRWAPEAILLCEKIFRLLLLQKKEKIFSFSIEKLLFSHTFYFRPEG
jgi:hypothetical protein